MVEWMYRSTYSWPLVGGQWSASVPAALTPGDDPSVLNGYEVLTTWRVEKYCPYGDWNSDPSAIQPVSSRYTDCSTPAHLNWKQAYEFQYRDTSFIYEGLFNNVRGMLKNYIEAFLSKMSPHAG
jgi:hypothetical protein